MSKPNWRAKVTTIILALALVLGLAVVTAAPASAQVPGELTKEIRLADGTLVDCGNPASGIIEFKFTYTDPDGPDPTLDRLELDITGPRPYHDDPPPDGPMIQISMDADGSWGAGVMDMFLAMGVVDRNGNGSLDMGSTDTIQYDFVKTETSGVTPYVATLTFWLDTTKNWEVNPLDIGLPWDRPVHTSVWPMAPCYGHADGYQIDSRLYSTGGLLDDDLGNDMPLVNEPYILPDIALDVKGSCQRFYAKNTGPWTILTEWSVHPGVNSPVVTVLNGGGENDDWIEICAGIPSDAIVKAYLDAETWEGEPGRDGNIDIVLNAEKKWGEISDSDLDVDGNTPAIDHTKVVTLDRYESGGQIPSNYVPNNAYTYGDGKVVGDVIPEQETITEWVYAEFYWGALDEIREYLAGHAIVHFWLFDDTQLNQAYIDALMAYLEAGNDGWTAVGEYDPPDEFKIAMNTTADNPFEYIDYLLTHDLDPAAPVDYGAADTTEWKDPEEGIPNPNAPGNETVVGPYVQVETEGDMPGEVRGRAQAELRAFEEEKVMIITLAEYPVDYHGENRIAVQKGKKEFTPSPPPPDEVQVKLPRIKWAGEKLVLEKYWGDQFIGRGVTFQLEHPGLGTLEPITGDTVGEVVFTTVREDGVARCILDSEDPGQADVKVVLYTFYPTVGTGGEILNPESILGDIPPDGSQIESEHAFIVFFLKFEEITMVDPDPLALDPNVDAEVGVQVKGWFINSNPSTRPAREVDWDGDGIADAINPAGRWVLPDDWPTLAGADPMLLRAHWDLMDNWTDEIDSSNPRGPFNTDVHTTDDPGEAEYPVIGPNSWLQPFTTENMWDASAVVPADATIAAPATTQRTGTDVRDTVVPNGVIEWYDAVMPAARIWFRATGTTASQLMKTAVSPYVSAGPTYEAPFYYYEIPNSPFIPPLSNLWATPPFYAPEGYWWDSWGFQAQTILGIVSSNLSGPYPFWTELGPSAADPNTVCVYSDNNGFAYVQLDALTEQGSAVVTATADYPYLRKHPAIKSDAVTQEWGDPPQETVTWDFPHGLVQDESAVFLRHYDGSPVVLPTMEEPAELLAVWFYDEGTMTWSYFVPGWESTLMDLEFCNTYMVIVMDACTWEIPQP